MPERGRGEQHRDRHVAAGREDRRGPLAGEDRRGLRHGRREPERVEDGVDADVDGPQRAQREAPDADAGGRDEAGLEAAMPTEPGELRSGRPGAERASDGQRGVDVAARPARRRSAAASFQVPRSTVSREIDSRMPTAAKLTMQRRAAGADERQRDAGHRDQRDDDADVDERLDAQPGGDARGEQRAERVRRGERDPDPGVGQDDEQADDDDRRR